MKTRCPWIAKTLLFGLLFSAGSAWAQNAEILYRQVDEEGQGMTVLRVWGSHEEMGFAMGASLAAEIVDGVEEARALGGMYYGTLRGIMDGMLWLPAGVEDELSGILSGVKSVFPEVEMDVTDLKVMNTFGDWGYYGGCRSHACWGEFVQGDVRSLATRRLDFGSGYDIIKHHVLCAWEPDDGSPRWVNLAWPGYVAVITGVNEYGTLVSLHDYSSDFDPTAGSLPRSVATRLVLTGMEESPVEEHLAWAEEQLTTTPVATGTFIDYYAPEGLGGVFTCSEGQVCSLARRPQAEYFSGQVIMTTNSQTDGMSTPSGGEFMADYYDLGGPKSIEDHFALMGHSMHLLTVAYRGRGDMEFWVEGHTDSGTTTVVALEWSDLFPESTGVDAGTETDAGVESDAGTETDAGVETDAGAESDPEDAGGCGCGSSSKNSFSWILLALGLVPVLRRRRVA